MGPIELTDFVGIDTMLATMTGLYNGSMTVNIVHAHFLRQWSNQECLEKRQDRDFINTMKKEIR